MVSVGFLTAIPLISQAELGMSLADFEKKFGKQHPHGYYVAAGYKLEITTGLKGEIVRILASSKSGSALTDTQAKGLVKSLIGNVANNWSIDESKGNQVMVEDSEFAEIENLVAEFEARAVYADISVVQAQVGKDDTGALVRSGESYFYVAKPLAGWTDNTVEYLRIATTGETYQYTTVNGSLSTIPKIIILPSNQQQAKPKKDVGLNGATLNGADGL